MPLLPRFLKIFTLGVTHVKSEDNLGGVDSIVWILENQTWLSRVGGDHLYPLSLGHFPASPPPTVFKVVIHLLFLIYMVLLPACLGAARSPWEQKRLIGSPGTKDNYKPPCRC